MNRNRHFGGVAFSPSFHPACGCRSAFTWKELLAVIAVIGLLIALCLPATESARESARRASCRNNLKQIGLAVYNYSSAYKVLPAGTICTAAPISPDNPYDVLAEAAKTDAGSRGTGFLLAVLPYTEGDLIHKSWDFRAGVSSTKKASPSSPSNYELANTNINNYYCPTRRYGLRPQDGPMMLSPSWTGGGTDYGGCAGRHAAFTLKSGYNLCGARTYYDPNFFPSPFHNETDDTPAMRWGVFGRVNTSTTLKEVSDGTSNTIMTGELQRITDLSPTSKDGWAIGGPATLFTTGAMIARQGKTLTSVVPPAAGKLIENGFFGSPGSEHLTGAHFGMVDGSVRFIAFSIDPDVLALLGSMADGVPVVSP